jgi:hypothetical protein
MNCEDFENVIVELVRSQPLQAGVRNQALAHCSVCDSCAQRLDQENALSVGLQALGAEMKTTTVPAQLESNLILAFRRQTVAGPVSNRWSYLAIAAAVIIAATLSVAVFRMRESRTQQPVEFRSQNLSPVTATPVDETTIPSHAPNETTPPVKPKTLKVAATHRPKKRRHNVSISPTFVSVVVGSVTDAGSPEVASPIVPLSYTNAANFQEGAQVMRVELPRYAMARFGLPVNMERYDERVKADVWIGADGLARAIRFVQ